MTDIQKINTILGMVAETYGIDVGALQEKTRQRYIVEPRQIAMYLLRRYTNMSYTWIGFYFMLNHATVIHAVKNITGLVDTNYNGFAANVKRMNNELDRIFNVNKYTSEARKKRLKFHYLVVKGVMKRHRQMSITKLA